MLQLKQDKYFDKIPETLFEQLISEAMALGEQEALKRKNISLKTEFEKEGYRIEYVCNAPYVLKQGLMTRAEIICDNKGKRVLIYTDSIDYSLAQLHKENIRCDRDAIESLYLAHEYFHFLEDSKRVNAPVLEHKIERLKLFGRSFLGSLHAPSEIASNRFAQCLCSSDFNPLLLDTLFTGEDHDEKK